MISFSAISSASDAADYYADLAKAAEYYDGAGRVPSRWLGAGAVLQNLHGEVGRDALRDQLAGKVRDADCNARQLGINRAGDFQHRGGWDFAVSAPKSVSIESLVHSNGAVQEAHRRAVSAVVAYLERYGAAARINGQHVATGNLTIAAYDHVSSRSGDPQLHTHLLVANVTHDHGGRARSVSNERLLEHRAAADAVYHATLSRELQALGYSVRHDRAGHVEIASYSPEQLADFSTRSREIEASLAARGQTRESSSAEARQVAALATRAPKNTPETREAHAARWQAQAQAFGLTPAHRDQAAPTPSAWDVARIARDSVREAAEHLNERESVMRPADINREAARASAGRCTWTDIESAMADALARGELIRGEDGRITTRDALAVESETDAGLESGRGDHREVMTGCQFDQALAKFERSRGFALSDEQRGAARMILTGDDRYQGVQGLAGTGKTTLLAFVREAAESQGWRVIGHSSGAEQAATMQRESGIQSTTTASWLLESERDSTAAGDQKVLIVMDEAGQAGSRQFLAALSTTERAGARMIALGDHYQHQSVEAGRAFARGQAHMPVATLGAASIRRQRTDEAKAAVARVLAGDHASAVRGLRTVEVRSAQTSLPADATREQRREAARADNQQVIARLARDFTAMPREQRDKALIITSTNADRVAINEAVRGGLHLRGDLGDDVQVSTLRKADLSAVEAKRSSSYEPGQIVEVRCDYARAQLARGSQWQVVAAQGDLLRVRDNSGRERTIDPAKIQLQAYTREVRALAIGDRIRWIENHRATHADRPLDDGLRVRNGSGATVVAVSSDGQQIDLRTDAGQQIKLDTAEGQKLDHAYASTSYSAQGVTVDAVKIHHNVEAGRHGDRETYVSLTRARDDLTLYTQDIDRAAAQSGVTLEKSAAHDVSGPEWSPEDAPTDRDRTRDRGAGWG
ncbi:MobF family relaxase [Metallibacterium scheffleri]|uniref:TrwC relaxase domain-containing protein n=1 Tax=Metallibacterium scheffleri TaxID=993689 RepID=A0A4S3KKF1_9GAMM|nr:MobF family relaxase [Metallibacterium scheffleri]THD09305.1 hypothetical protein B1806_11275 [Metallibacterium scheffleri]